MAYLYRQSSISDLLIAFLFSSRNSYTFHKILRERSFQKFKRSSVRTSLSRLKKKNLINKNDNGYYLSLNCRKSIKEKERFNFIPSPFPKNSPNQIMVSFDVKQSMNRERKWLRDQLKIFGFKMLHQSLWMGPGPLPEKFNKKVLTLGLKESIKTFKLAKK